MRSEKEIRDEIPLKQEAGRQAYDRGDLTLATINWSFASALDWVLERPAAKARLDPRPWIDPQFKRQSEWKNGWAQFDPRPGYSQNREDYA